MTNAMSTGCHFPVRMWTAGATACIVCKHILSNVVPGVSGDDDIKFWPINCRSRTCNVQPSDGWSDGGLYFAFKASRIDRAAFFPSSTRCHPHYQLFKHHCSNSIRSNYFAERNARNALPSTASTLIHRSNSSVHYSALIYLLRRT